MAKATGLPKWAWALIIVGGLLIGIAVLGTVAAIAIPGFVRARNSANEASALGTVRMVASAQSTAAAYNGGLYLPLDCLASPSACIPDYTGVPFMAEIRGSGSGYSPRFVAGTQATPEERELASAKAERSLKGFAFLMIPDQPGQTGRRSFCVDETGEVCFTEGGAPPDTTGGRCAACAPLR
jgi:hypothetical protein